MVDQSGPLSLVVTAVRRVVGLHGDAVSNAARSVQDNKRARRHRVQVEEEVRAIHSVDNLSSDKKTD